MEDSSKSQHENMQRIQLQEVDLSENPKDIMVELRSDLVDKLRAGSTIEVTGVLRSTPLNKGSLMGVKYILAHSILVIDEEALKTVVSEEEAIQVRALCDSLDFRERLDYLIWSWSGHLLCSPLLKRALFLQAVGSPEESKFGHRSGIHILIAGDPGTVKTHLLRAMRNLVLGSRMVSAEAASQAGLVAACQQVEDLYTGKKRWALTPGALALTPKEATCCVDELNLYKYPLSDVNTALESGKVYKTTGPVKGILDAPAAILAGANPMAGDQKKFVTGKGMGFLGQLGFDRPELQRWDLIYVLLDQAEYDRDFDIAMSVMGSGKNTSSAVNLDFVQKYVALSKKVNPIMTEEAITFIATQHANKRSIEVDEHLRSHRLVVALQRLALATARFDFAERVTLEHVEFAQRVFAQSINESDPGLLTTGIDKASRQRNSKTESLVAALMDTKSSIAKLSGVEGKEIREHLKANSVLFDNNTDFNSAMRRLPFLTASGSKWIYEEA